MSSPLIALKPLAITDAMLVSSSVPETDYPVYTAGASWNQGDRCIVTTGVHLIYESIYAGSQSGHDPTLAASATYWKKVSATNKFKCFDTSSSTQTVQAGSASYRFTPGQVVNGVVLLNAVGDSARVRMIDPVAGTVYDKTYSMTGVLRKSTPYDWCYSRRKRRSSVVALDLPSYYGADILVDVTAASGNVSIGVLAIGYQQRMGKGVKLGLRGGITDYSDKAVNSYGDMVLNVLGYADKMNLVLVCDNSEIDDIRDQFIELRATPCIYVATELYRSALTFGIYGEFELLIAYQTESEYSVDFKGFT